MLPKDSVLPSEVRDKLAQIELELSEGDITEKGFFKKREQLLAPYLSKLKTGVPSNNDATQQPSAGATGGAASQDGPGPPSTPTSKRRQRRLTRNESRYHSEIRQEAVQQALKEWKKETDEPKYMALAPLRRKRSDSTLVPNIRASDSSSDDDSTLPSSNGETPGKDKVDLKSAKKKTSTKQTGGTAPLRAAPLPQNPPAAVKMTEKNRSKSKQRSERIEEPPKPRSRLLRHRSRDPHGGRETENLNPGVGSPLQRVLQEDQRLRKQNKRSSQIFGLEPSIVGAVERSQNSQKQSSAVQETDIADRALPVPPTRDRQNGQGSSEEEEVDSGTLLEDEAVYVNTASTHDSGLGSAERRACVNSQDYANTRIVPTSTSTAKVSEKIQSIMDSLQRPKRKPLQEYYNDDDDAELEEWVKQVDPNAPKATGTMVTPIRGDFPPVMASEGRTMNAKSIESLLERHAHVLGKFHCASVLDHSGKLSVSMSYSKLHTRAIKVAHMLQTKTFTVVVPNSGKEKRPLCITGDKIALVYPNTEPLQFLVGFYGCILAGMVPVPVEVPITPRDTGLQQFGFLLGSCSVKVALTSEACLKGIPKVGTVTPSNTGSSQNNSNSMTGNYQNSTNGSNNSGGSPTSNSASFPSNSHLNPNDVAEFKGWPRMQWLVTEHLNKPPKDWKPSPLPSDAQTAYIEYVTDKEGSVKGVTVSREGMMAHCRSITAAMGYKEGEIMVNVLDFKRDIGLWHGVLAAIYAGMRVVYVPYSVMKINPTSWMFHTSKLQAVAALVKSRDLHWSVMATPRDANGLAVVPTGNQAPMQLSSLRCVVVADGANPWCLSPCEQFAAALHTRGLRPDAICPVAGSPETGSVCLRRPTETGGLASGRGTLSMHCLSYGVVQIDEENSLTSLTVQDSGQVVPGGLVVVVQMKGPSKLCRTNEVGEICLHAPSTGTGYYGLKGHTQQAFHVQPLSMDDKPLGPANYVRSGLIGFLTPQGLVFVVGNKNSMMEVSGRQHSADDVIATVLAVDAGKFIYRGRIAVFSVKVLKDERICVIAEQKPDVEEGPAFDWMVQVIKAVDAIHHVSLYCIALVPANSLPKTALGGLHIAETRQKFVQGTLQPSTILMCPQNAVLNLPKPRENQNHKVGAASMMVGNLVQGARIASATGRELTFAPDEPINLVDILRQRAAQTPDHMMFTLVNAKGIEVDSLNCGQLLKKSERIGALLLDKGHLTSGDHVALIFPPGLELVVAFYGCLAAGLVPVCIRPPSVVNLTSTLITVRMIVDVSKSVALLSSNAIIKLLRCKEASHRINAKAWPTVLDIDDMPSSSVARKKNMFGSNTDKKPTDICYLDFSVSTTGQLAGIVQTYSTTANICKSLKVSCELYPSRHVALSLDPYSGLGFVLWNLSSIYSGHHSILIPPAEVETNPNLWIEVVSKQKVRDTFCSYAVMENCVRELAPQIAALKDKGLSLACLRTCVAVAEERPRVALCNAFTKLFAPLGLTSRAVSTSFGCRVNVGVCMQGASSPDPTVVYVDARALRNDRITLVEKGAPHSLPLMESGKLLPGCKVVIANPETKGQCADSHLGEIWVASNHNAAGYFSIFGEETHLHTDHFTAKLRTGDTVTTFARTGYLGFLKQTASITADGELHDAIFVVGAIDETLMLRGMRYHPVDLESTLVRCHKRVIESAVFIWSNLLVVVAETDPDTEYLDMVPAITSALLEEHHLVAGVVVLVDPFTIPINSRGEKQRMHLRDAFVKDRLDPLYVAYNM